MMLTNRRRCQLLQLHDAPLTRHPSANDRTWWVWSPESNWLLLKRVSKAQNLLAIHAWMLTPTSMEWNDSKNVKVITNLPSNRSSTSPSHFLSQLLEFQASSSVSTRELSRRPYPKHGAQISASTRSMVNHVPDSFFVKPIWIGKQRVPQEMGMPHKHEESSLDVRENNSEKFQMPRST